jgi:hypothetical protein
MAGRGNARESAPEAAVKKVPLVCREANLAVGGNSVGAKGERRHEREVEG